jgi:hypothetical protein
MILNRRFYNHQFYGSIQGLFFLWQWWCKMKSMTMVVLETTCSYLFIYLFSQIVNTKSTIDCCSVYNISIFNNVNAFVYFYLCVRWKRCIDVVLVLRRELN